MSIKIGNITLKNRYILAPMAGITSTTFRRICASFGASLTVGEMVSDKALVYESSKTFDLLKRYDSEDSHDSILLEITYLEDEIAKEMCKLSGKEIEDRFNSYIQDIRETYENLELNQLVQYLNEKREELNNFLEQNNEQLSYEDLGIINSKFAELQALIVSIFVRRKLDTDIIIEYGLI